MGTGFTTRGSGEGRRFGKRRRQAIVSFGNPVDPYDETSVVLAGDMTAARPHNGVLDDIDGSWVELLIDGTQGNAIGDPITCHHNLYTESATGWAEEPKDDEPNCRWFVTRWEHSGAAATVWDDLRVPTSAGQKGVGSPPAFTQFTDDGGGSNGVFLEFFDDDNAQELFFTAQIPHTWKQNTDIEAHVHWTPSLGSVPGLNEVVAWGLEYTWANRAEVFPATTLIGNNVHAPPTATLIPGMHYTTEIGDITKTDTGAAGTVSSQLICRVFRDTGDTITNDTFTGVGNHEAGLMEIDFHYQVDGHGSDDEHDKTGGWELRDRPFQIYRQSGDNMDANSIDLRVVASPFLLVDNSNPLEITLFFVKAVK